MPSIVSRLSQDLLWERWKTRAEFPNVPIVAAAEFQKGRSFVIKQVSVMSPNTVSYVPEPNRGDFRGVCISLYSILTVRLAGLPGE
jgi:hypothetical protein